jgi:hypothetical protein
MKNINCINKYIFLLAFLIISNVKVNAQCNLDFDNLIKSMSNSETEFYSFAINNGYKYNSNDKIFECNNNRLLFSTENVSNNSQNINLDYVTTDSFNYMKIKEDALKYGFKFELSNQKSGDVYTFRNLIILCIKTTKYKDITIYAIGFGVTLTD